MSVVYTVGTFQGPLELLLNLIEREQLPISEISLARVAEQFLEYVREMPQFDSDLVSRFLAIAATLVAIKAQSLLPVLDLEEEVETDIDELEYRLRMYAVLKESTRVIEKHYSACKPLFTRQASWKTLHTFIPDPSITTEVLQHALEDMLQKSDELQPEQPEKLPEVKVRSIKSLEEVMCSIAETIRDGVEFKLNTSKPYTDPLQRAEALISFLAILELVRSGVVSAEQNEYHEDISVTPIRSTNPQQVAS